MFIPGGPEHQPVSLAWKTLPQAKRVCIERDVPVPGFCFKLEEWDRSPAELLPHLPPAHTCKQQSLRTSPRERGGRVLGPCLEARTPAHPQ